MKVNKRAWNSNLFMDIPSKSLPNFIYQNILLLKRIPKYLPPSPKKSGKTEKSFLPFPTPYENPSENHFF